MCIKDTIRTGKEIFDHQTHLNILDKPIEILNRNKFFYKVK